jgi:acyl-coenzyme A synthetase/AMP-(fatty) acid ligase
MNWIIENLEVFGDKQAVIQKDGMYSFDDLYKATVDFKRMLKANRVITGEVTALLSDYSFNAIALFLALMDNKNVIVPIGIKIKSEIDERVKETLVDKVISLSDGKIGVNETGLKDKKHNFIATLQSNNHAGLVLFSSGSSGKPKAMVHDLDNLLDIYKNKRPKGLVFLVFLMFDHIGGLNTLFNVLSMGGTIVIPENRDADYICGLIEKHKIQILPSSPTFLNLVMISEAYNKYDLSSLIMITYGTEPMPESLLKKLKEVFPRVRFLQTFGTSETGISKTSSKSSTSTFFKIDDPNIEYKIMDGELWLKSKTKILGYLNYSMESFTDDGWFKTGDLVETTEDGYIRIIGRNNDVINVGGQKVMPIEVESVILQMPQIAECMVYGENNIITAQNVAVDVVLKDDVNAVDIKRGIRKFCRDRLDNYKIPVKINVVAKPQVRGRFKKIRRR